MDNTIHQPGKNPTNKLTAATLSGAVMSVVGLVLKNMAPEWYDAEVILALTPIVLFAVGWFVPDAPNQIVIVEENKDGVAA